MATTSPAQSRLDNAILSHEHAEAEVERLCDILERAAGALRLARQTKRAAQQELDEAAQSAKASAASAAPPSPRVGARHVPTAAAGSKTTIARAPSNSSSNGHNGHARQQQQQQVSPGGNNGARMNQRQFSGAANPAVKRHEYVEEHTKESAQSEEYSDEEYSSEEEEESGDEEEDSEEEDGFDMGNEALEQIRYRLETAKIDPNSPRGTKLLDELLLRLQTSNEQVAIDAEMVNEYIDELLFESEDAEDAVAGVQHNDNKQQPSPPPPPQNPNHQQYPRIRISRGGKVLGWYQGQLDDRGYAREGQGSMYYDAGHECHGTWQNDEMIGRGIYQWSDGHVYDGEWLNGKRHGLGRFIRPDNVVLYGRYDKGHHKGSGVRWSADRKEAQVVVDGLPKKSVSLSKAKDVVTNLGFDDVLPPV